MPIGLNGQNDIVRFNGNSPDEVVATKAKPSLTAEEVAALEALPPQSPIKQVYLASTAKTELPAYHVAAVRALVDPARITTWTNRAALVAAGLTTAFFTDIGVGGSYWDYIGGRWRPQARRVTLFNMVNEVSTQATSSAVLLAILVQAGLWQDGDILDWRASFTKSGGTAETASTDWRIGASAGSIGSTLGLSTAGLTTTQTQQHNMNRVRRLSPTTARNISTPGSSGLGVTTAALATRTIPDADAAPFYWQVLGNMSVGAETLTLTGATLYLESGA